MSYIELCATVQAFYTKLSNNWFLFQKSCFSYSIFKLKMHTLGLNLQFPNPQILI